MIDFSTKYKYFKEWYENGGKDTILSTNLLDAIDALKYDEDGNPIEESLSPVLNSAMLAIIGSHLSNPYFNGEQLSEYESILQKAQFFEQFSINTEEEFDLFFDEYFPKQKIIYRGVKEAKWRLYNSLQRHWITTKKEDDENKYKDFIKELIKCAKEENNSLLSKFLKLNNISPENDIAVLSFLQHYGCPTPMIDWTYNLNSALYFAFEDVRKYKNTDIDNYTSIYVMKEEWIKDSSVREIVENVLKSYEDKIKRDVLENGKKEGLTMDEIEKFFSPYRLELTAKFMYGKITITGASKVDSLFIYPLAYFSDRDEDKIDLIPFSLNNNLNIVNQDGIFIFNKSPVLSLEELGMKVSKEQNPDSSYAFCYCYNINKELKDYVLKKLESINVNKDSIYPDPYKLVSNAFENATKINQKND